MMMHEQRELADLRAELDREIRGAAFLARQVELAWLDGIAEGQRRSRQAAEPAPVQRLQIDAIKQEVA